MKEWEVPGLPAAASAIRAFIGEDEVTATGAALIAQEALRAATPSVLAAALADIADDFALFADAGADWAGPAARILDHMSAHIRNVTEGASS